jgi:hypothetical protein
LGSVREITTTRGSVETRVARKMRHSARHIDEVAASANEMAA